MAKAAVEMGCWGSAHAAGVPLAELLGGTRETASPPGSRSASSVARGAGGEGARRAREGYRKIKLKIKPGRDVEYVRAVREALGPDAPLMADANSAYTLADADTAGAARRVST
jgi:o-succinylbenzoate synthase